MAISYTIALWPYGFNDCNIAGTSSVNNSENASSGAFFCVPIPFYFLDKTAFNAQKREALFFAGK
jgi:hypothetical protein